MCRPQYLKSSETRGTFSTNFCVTTTFCYNRTAVVLACDIFPVARLRNVKNKIRVVLGSMGSIVFQGTRTQQQVPEQILFSEVGHSASM